MSSVTVFCPNARRQQVKVEPNLKILQVSIDIVFYHLWLKLLLLF